jgi:glutamate synthase domain-containing protein 3
LVSLDARELTTRQLNVRLKELAQAGEEIEVLNPEARHNIAVAIFHPCKIHVKGSVGYYGASLLDGPEITIDGNAGWALGENLMAGKIALGGDAGASVAASMRGGEVIVRGGAGARAGISMKGGTLVIGGASGFLTGFMMQKGRIIVCGDTGEAVGDSMYEGVIYVGGETGALGNDARIEEIGEDELVALWGTLESHGIDERPHFTKIVSAKRLYHFDSLERLEKTVV